MIEMMEAGIQKEQPNIAVLLTCFNRKEKTKTCITSLAEQGEDYRLEFIVTDDQSTDGTAKMLQTLPFAVRVLEGTGGLFWTGGMNRSIDEALVHADRYQYIMFVNDDVRFYPDAVSRLLKRLEQTGADIVVGSTMDSHGKMSYGGVRMTSKHFARYQMIEPSEQPQYCDTFNCNCILMKTDIFQRLGRLDPAYIHSMGDYDYGMTASGMGFAIVNCDAHIGTCDDNGTEGTWKDISLSRKERLRLKESPKGLPRHDWFHFVRKNYGFLPACYHSITPYLRILLKK